MSGVNISGSGVGVDVCRVGGAGRATSWEYACLSRFFLVKLKDVWITIFFYYLDYDNNFLIYAYPWLILTGKSTGKPIQQNNNYVN